MSNTERMKVITVVRQAKLQVAESRRREGLSAPQSEKLKKLYLQIDALEDALILKEVSDNIDVLEEASKSLLTVNDEIKNDIEDIEEVAEYVEKAAKYVGILVKVAKQAAKLFV
jgi:methionine synthase II (cobalamin-independent)